MVLTVILFFSSGARLCKQYHFVLFWFQTCVTPVCLWIQHGIKRCLFFLECASLQTFKICIVLFVSLQVLRWFSFWIQHGISFSGASTSNLAHCRSALEKVYRCTEFHRLHWCVHLYMSQDACTGTALCLRVQVLLLILFVFTIILLPLLSFFVLVSSCFLFDSLYLFLRICIFWWCVRVQSFQCLVCWRYFEIHHVIYSDVCHQGLFLQSQLYPILNSLRWCSDLQAGPSDATAVPHIMFDEWAGSQFKKHAAYIWQSCAGAAIWWIWIHSDGESVLVGMCSSGKISMSCFHKIFWNSTSIIVVMCMFFIQLLRTRLSFIPRATWHRCPLTVPGFVFAVANFVFMFRSESWWQEHILL